FLGQLYGRAAKVAGILLQLALKTAEEGEGVGGRTGKPGENLFLVQAANLARGVLDDGFAHGDLAVGGHHHAVVTADAEHGRGPDTRGVAGGGQQSAARNGGRKRLTFWHSSFEYIAALQRQTRPRRGLRKRRNGTKPMSRCGILLMYLWDGNRNRDERNFSARTA